MDSKKIMELVDQMRLAVPQDVKSAQEILLKKDSIINQAHAEARRIKASAEEEFRARLDQNELVKAARRRSDEMVEEAQRKAHRIMEQAESDARTRRTEADAYALQTLRRLEKELTTLLTTVRRGLEVLGAEITQP